MVIASPEVAYLLLMAGLLGLLIELTNPGGVVPGVAGAISLLLGLYAFSVLPVSWVGAMLILVGLGLLISEAFVTSYGLLAVSGLVSLVFGSVMLIDAPVPGLQVGLGLELIIPTAVVLALATALLASRAVRARRAPILTGAQGMVGEVGELLSAVDPAHEGRVFVHGESWAATAARPLPEGSRVRIEQVEGQTLRVAPL
jgi:membrane-bound serine protease (ClpP class)